MSFICKYSFNCTALYCVRETFMYFICKNGFNCTVLYCVRDNSPWWANVHSKSILTINKLSYFLFLFVFLDDSRDSISSKLNTIQAYCHQHHHEAHTKEDRGLRRRQS